MKQNVNIKKQSPSMFLYNRCDVKINSKAWNF